jgi:hypothetical protein
MIALIVTGSGDTEVCTEVLVRCLVRPPVPASQGQQEHSAPHVQFSAKVHRPVSRVDRTKHEQAPALFGR